MPSRSDDLIELATTLGVATWFDDWQGGRVEVPRDAIAEVLAAMGVGASGTERAPAERPRCVVVREAETRVLPVDIPEDGPTEVTLRLEGGAFRMLAPDAQTAVEPGGTTITIPDDLPLGYHSVIARSGETSVEIALIVTPRRLGMPDTVREGPSWGFAVQLYSARSRKSWGVGDLGDLADLAA